MAEVAVVERRDREHANPIQRNGHRDVDPRNADPERDQCADVQQNERHDTQHVDAIVALDEAVVHEPAPQSLHHVSMSTDEARTIAAAVVRAVKRARPLLHSAFTPRRVAFGDVRSIDNASRSGNSLPCSPSP